MPFDLSTATPAGGFDLSTAKPLAPVDNRGFGAQLSDSLSDIPRQIGLTARYGIEGVGNTLDALSAPIRMGLNAVLPKKQSLTGLVTGEGPQDAIKAGSGQYIANLLHLPSPANATERVVGDATRLMAGGALPIAAASKIAQAAPLVASGVGNGIASSLAANPLAQTISSGAAGAAGGYARETGGGEGAQFAASLAAGIAAPVGVNALTSGINATANAGRSVIGAVNNLASGKLALPNAQIDLQVNNLLKGSGITLADLPYNAQQGIRNDVASSLKTNGTLSPEAVQRLADYRLTGTTPTAATLTLDPAMVSQQKNLAKIGINSKDTAAQQLGQVENSNNNQLISGLNDLGANTTDTAIVGGRRVMNALADRNDTAKGLIDTRYAAARATDGRSAALDPSAFTNQANNALDEALLGGKLPSDVRNLLNNAATGKMPLTVDVAEQLKTRIGDLQRSSTDMAERKALGLVRQSLDNTPLLDGQGQGAIDAFNKARSLNKAWMGIVDKTPALQAVRDGIEPDKFVQQFIVGGGPKANVSDLAALRQSIKGSPDAMAAVKQQITSHLKAKALNGAADEVGSMSQSSYNKALSSIGDEKLSMFFAPAEVSQLKAIGRVASYEQFQPKGSAVNNSNTAGTAIANVLDRIGNSTLLSKIPFGNSLASPIQNISIGIKSKQAMNIPNSLAGMPLQNVSKPNALMLSPAAFMGHDDTSKPTNSLLPR